MVFSALLRLNKDDDKRFSAILLIFLALLMAYVAALTYNLYTEVKVSLFFVVCTVIVALAVWIFFYWFIIYYLPNNYIKSAASTIN